MNLGVVGTLIITWLICWIAGYGVTYLVLPRHWRCERLLLVPTFGAAVIIFLSSVFSYAGLGMRTAAPLVCGMGIAFSVGVLFSTRRDHRPLGNWWIAIYTNLLGLCAGLSALASVIFYNAWNPYTDTFTYIAIADYLLDASYFTPADPGAYHPVLTQMALYQRAGLRMGSNFLLAFFTVLFGEEYSFDVYMPVLALGLWIGVPGFWVLCRRALFMPALATLVATGFYGLHTALPIAIAIGGWMPQTWGFAFLFPMIALHIRSTSRAERARRIIAAGTMGAMTLLSYTEIEPFAVIAIGTCYLIRLLKGRLRFVDALVSGVGPLLIAIILVPVAAWNFPKATLVQFSALVGEDPNLHFFDYVSMLAGFRPLAGHLGFFPGMLRITAVMALISVFYGCFLGPLKTRRQSAYLSFVFLLALGWFSLIAVNPWNPNGLGHPWNTYKLVTYGFFLFASMWGAGLVVLWQKGGGFRLVALGQVLVFFVFFPFATIRTAEQVSMEMYRYTGVDKNPTAEYRRLRQVLADLSPGIPVNLIIPSDALGHRQMVAYFLRRPVIANWSDAPHIFSHLERRYQALEPDLRYPNLVYTPLASDRKVANLTVDRDHSVVFSNFGPGWHDIEREGPNWWRWLEQQGEIQLFVPRPGRLALQGEIAVIGSAPRSVTIGVAGYPNLNFHYTLQAGWFSPFTSEGFILPRGGHKVVLSADGPSAQFPNDSRNVRIGVRNFLLTFAPD